MQGVDNSDGATLSCRCLPVGQGGRMACPSLVPCPDTCSAAMQPAPCLGKGPSLLRAGFSPAPAPPQTTHSVPPAGSLARLPTSNVTTPFGIFQGLEPLLSGQGHQDLFCLSSQLCFGLHTATET